METTQNKKQKRVVIFEKEIDFSELEKWTDPAKDDFPVISYISFYKAIGLVKAAEDYIKEHPDYYLYTLDSIFCNFTTHKHIKRLIEKNWKVYDIDIKENNAPFWKTTTKYPKGVKRNYEKTLSRRVQESLNKDFATYCPGMDDSLNVNTIILVDYVDVDDEDADNSNEE